MDITVKEVPSTVFLASTHTTTIPQLEALAGRIIAQLFAAADQSGLALAGPMEFHYDGIDGDPQKEFKLVIAVPLASRPEFAPPPFSILETTPFRCAALDYVGAMADIRSGYMRLMQGMGEQNLRMSSECREVYKHWIAPESPENVTELQYGIA
jgi:effector-binding domain-containing protein